MSKPNIPKANASTSTNQEELAMKYACQLKVTQEINQLIGSDEKIEYLLQSALHHLQDTLGYYATQIYRLSPAGKDLWLYMEMGSGSKPVTQNADIFSIEEENIISHAVRNNEPVYIPDIRQGPYSYYYGQSETDTEIGSELAIPLQSGQLSLGVLRVQSGKLNDFDDADINFLSSLSNLLASAIRNAQTVQRLNDDLQEMKILYSLQRREELGKQLQAGSKDVLPGYQYDRTNIAIAEADELPPSAKLAIAKEYMGVSTIQNEDRKELVAPLKLYGETIGVLGIEDIAEGREWSTEDIRLLEEVSSQVALAVENARLLQQTQERTKELSILFKNSRQLSETNKLSEIYEILATQIINYLNADICCVSLLNKDRTHFEQVVVKAKTAEWAKQVATINSNEPRLEAIEDFPILRQMIKHPGMVIEHLDDSAFPFLSISKTRLRKAENGGASRHDVKNEVGQQLHTSAIFPVVVRSNLIGTVRVWHFHQQRDYTKNELQLAQVIISQVTVAIENAQLFKQTENTLAETQKLYDISRLLVEATTLEEIFDVVIENVKIYNVDRISISLLDWAKSGQIEKVKIVANWDRESEKILPVGSQISADMFPLVEAFAQPPFHPMISEDLSRAEMQDERMDEAFRLFMYRGLGAITLFSAPMFLGTEYKGVLSISTRTPHTYTDQETRIYQTLADQAIIAIERYRLLETTRRERDWAAFLYQLGQKLSQTITIDAVKEAVLSFTERAGATHGEIYITDGENFLPMTSTIPERRKMPPDKASNLTKMILSQGFEAQALHTQETILKNRSQVDWDIKSELYPDWVQSIICTPFYSRRSNLQGVLTFLHTEENGFTEDHISMFESIAIQTSATLENIRLLEQTATALSETELLYNATRDFNSAQHIEDLLATLIKSFASSGKQAETGIDHMSIALITDLEEDSTPKRLDIFADWDKYEATSDNQIVVVTPNFQITSDDYPFIKQINPNVPSTIRPDRPTEPQDQLEGTAECLEKYLGKARSVLSIPLTVGNNWLGVLFIASRVEGFVFKPDIVSQITTLAGQVAVVIQNLQLVEETQQNLYNSEILSHLSQELLVADTVETIYNLSIDAVAATEPGRGAAIFIYDQVEGGVELKMVAVWDNPSQEWATVPVGSHFSAEDFGLGPLLKTGQTVISTKATEDERFSQMLQQLLIMMQIESLAAVPIWLHKEVNGFILIGNQKTTSFSPDTIRLYENIGRLMSGALENHYLFEEAQYRATQLQTAAEVSQAATSYLDLDTLLSQSVDLLRDRFGFYHASIFLVDEYQKYAVIAASTGEIGQQMLAMKHKLEVGGQSIVGTATGTGKPCIALDVGKDAVHFNNPLLPDTRSEMALPLIARGRVIGALDVQSTKEGAFTKSDVTILQSMANQLANAIEAARSFQESQKALEEVSKLHEHYLRDEWSTFLKEQKTAIGYRLAGDNLIALQDEDTWSSENHDAMVNEAIEAKHPIIIPVSSPTNGHGSNEDTSHDTSLISAAESKNVSTLVAPLTLHGQVVVGAIDFEISEKDKVWEEDTLRIIEAITNQAAQAIEAARLFEQTQAAREEAEALYEVGRTLVTSESEQEMFHTVLGKMLSTLGLNQGGVLFFEADKKFGKLHAIFEKGKPVKPDLHIPIEGNPSFQKLIETKKPLAIEDVANDPLLANVREINLKRNIASLLLVPIIINDEVVGAMGADAVGQKHAFTEREINLVSAMADQLSIMLQNRRLLDETRRRAIQLQTSSEVSRVATSILDQDIMLDEAAELIKDHFGFYHVQIFLTDDANLYAMLHKSTGEAGQQLLAMNYKVPVGDQSIIGQVTYQRKSIVVRDVDTGDSDLPYQFNEFLPNARAELAVPLQVGDRFIGVLDVHSTSPNDFTREDIAPIETLAAQLAIAIQNARAFREQQETAERLKEIDKLKTQFLANMSHELRTPLNSIIGFSRVILKGIDGPLTELQKADLTSIHNSGQHLLGLINNILDLSKIEAGKMELNFEEIEMSPIIKSVMSTALALVKDKPVELIQKVPDELPIVWADPTRIRQVILNLVSNACKFTDEGRVTLEATAEKEKIIISVSDTGIGIPEDKLDSIFEEFTQVDASTTRKVGGTGLGLPISRHFVEMHKGQIWVDSTPSKGSTFSFAIPVKLLEEVPETSIDQSSTTDAEDGQEKTVVVIDDNPGVINLYERFLENQNYKIVGINSNEDIIDWVRAYTPFAILLDVLVQNKDGWSILKDLKADPFTKDIPVIICSIVNDKNRGLALGAADYLTKPIVESELINALKHLDDQQKEQVKVLVIDDQADDILLIRRILEAAHPNYKIIEASNGKEGLELVRSRNPDLIILDLRMPEMDGFAVVDILKNDEEMRTIPIIVVSAIEPAPAEQQRLTGQIEVLLRKGIFTESELLEDVNKALERFHEPETIQLG